MTALPARCDPSGSQPPPRTVRSVRARVETVECRGIPVRLHTTAPAGEVGGGDGPTIVLVHGIGMSHRSFARSQRSLAATHRSVSVDLPGFGALPTPGRRLSVEELADLVVEAVRSRSAGGLVLVGQSMGTQVVVEAARRHPETVDALVLVSPVVDARRRRAALQAVDLVRDSFVEGVRMNTVLVTDYLRSIPQYLRQLGPMLRCRLEETIAEVEQPVLVVRGTRDPIARADFAATVAGNAPRGSLVDLPGPHHVQEHQPVAFADLVRALLRSGAPGVPR